MSVARIVKLVAIIVGPATLCAVCTVMLVANGAYLMTVDFGGGLAAWGESVGAVRGRGVLLLVSGILGPVVLVAWVIARLLGKAGSGRLEPAIRWCLAGVLIWDLLLTLMTTM